ncbi:MAG: T9SS C-terminal target domain-containing protein, partial [Ignavibacteriae bacterium]
SDSTWPGVFGSVVSVGSDTFLVCTDNAIYRSIDDGLTFSQMYRRDSSELKLTRLVGTNSSAVFALRDRASLIRSIDGGTTWQTITAVDPIPRYFVRFVDSLHGSGADDKTFYITDDGGRSWQEQPIPFVRYGIKMTVMLDQDHILLGGENGLLAMWTRATTSVPRTDTKHASRIKVYPSPVASSGQLTLAGMSTDNARIQLTDLLGNVKGRWEATSPSTQIQLSPYNVTSGVYFIAIEERGRVEVHPVMVVNQ